MLRFFARQVEERLDQEDRDLRARQCSADLLLRTCGAPALIVHDDEVIASRDLPLRSGDRLDVGGLLAADGRSWHDRLGFVTFEPLSYPDEWLVRSAARDDRATTPVIFDFTDPRDPVVRMRGVVVATDQRVLRPQFQEVLRALAQNRTAMSAKSLSRVLYGDDSRWRNVPPLMSKLRDQFWWLLAAKGYGLSDRFDVELRLPDVA